MPRLSIKETNRRTTTTMIMVIGHDDNINYDNDDDDGKDLMVDSEHHDTKNSSSCGQDHHSGIVHAWNHILDEDFLFFSWKRSWTKAFVGIG